MTIIVDNNLDEVQGIIANLPETDVSRLAKVKHLIHEGANLLAQINSENLPGKIDRERLPHIKANFNYMSENRANFSDKELKLSWEIDKLRAEIISLRNSRSWRLTKPFRQILDLYTGFRK